MLSAVKRDKLPQTAGPVLPTGQCQNRRGGGVLGCFLSQQHRLALIEIWGKECHKYQDMMQKQAQREETPGRPWVQQRLWPVHT